MRTVLFYLQFKDGSFRWVAWAWLDEMNDIHVSRLTSCGLIYKIEKVTE